MSAGLRCVCEAQSPLAAVALESSLPAHGCADCGGHLLDLAAYKTWRDAAPAVPAPLDPIVFEDAPGARACPGCSRLMHRLRAGARPPFRLDRCAPCGLVWFDRGEWPAVVAAGHATRLDELLGDAWQRYLQAAELRAHRETALRERHGDACIDELARIRDWLDSQPARDELLSLLRAGW